MDAIFLPEKRRAEAAAVGYVVPDWETIIRLHLSKVIKKNITKFLDQYMVNTLINKVRDKNPDIIDDVFFLHNFSTSNIKTILNWLLEEGVCIRDMNTILEAIADNLEESKRLSELMEKVREKLAWQFLTKIADDKKILHIIKVSPPLAQTLLEHIFIPQAKNELPYFDLPPEDSKKLNAEITKKSDCMKSKGFVPVFLTESNLRTAFSRYIKHYFGNWHCISDTELYSVSKDYSVIVEEELEVDEIKVNEAYTDSN